MVYSIQNNVAYINGNKGIYDGKINDNSVRYGRNAAANNFEYLKKLGGKRSESTDTFNYSDKNYGNYYRPVRKYLQYRSPPASIVNPPGYHG